MLDGFAAAWGYWEMVEKVSDRKLYQATVTNTYKQALVLDQQICAGTAYNPFFKFYENKTKHCKYCLYVINFNHFLQKGIKRNF